MANPITWQTINSNIDVDGFSRALARAGQGVSTGITGLQDILKGEQQLREANFNNTVNNSTQDFLNKMSQYSPEQLQQAMQDGSIDRLRSGYGVNLDPTKTNGAALQQLLQGKQQQVLSQNQFDDDMAERDSLGIQNQLRKQLAEGDISGAMATNAQLPQHLQGAVTKEIDQLVDSQRSNKFYSQLTNGNIGGAADLIPELAKNGDVSAHLAALKQARTQATHNQLTNTLASVEPEYNKRLKARNAEVDTFIKKELGLKPDMVGATEEQLNKYEQFVNGLPPLTRKTVQDEIYAPVLARYKESNLYDPAFENQLKLQQDSITADPGIHKIDLDQVQSEERNLIGLLADNGNIFAQEANNPATKESIHEMFSSVTKDNPVFKDLDGEDIQKLATQFVQLATEGPEIADSQGNIRKIPVPQTILKTMLEGADGNAKWLNGDSLETAVKDVMQKSGVADQWNEIEEVKTLSKKKLSELGKASGKADADYLPATYRNARNARKIIEAGKAKADEANKGGAEEAVETPTNDGGIFKQLLSPDLKDIAMGLSKLRSNETNFEALDGVMDSLKIGAALTVPTQTARFRELLYKAMYDDKK